MTTQPTIWQQIVSRFRPQNLSRPDDPLRYFHYLPHSQAAGISVTMESSLELSVVWACVTAISSALSSCHWNVYTKDSGRRKLLGDDPLAYLLNVRPNADMTAISLREVLLFGALTWGNGYAEIGRTLSGKASALWPLLPSRVLPRRDHETGDLYYDVLEQDGGRVRIESADMFHLRGPGITGLMGDNVVARAAQSMSLAAASERFAATYFGNNTVIGGVIEYPKAMSETAHNNLKTSWQDEHKGPDKAHRVAILEDGAKWVPFGSQAKDSQLVEVRTFQVEEICFVPGTKVFTLTGARPIETIAVGDLVWTHKGRLRRVRNVMSREYNGPAVTVHANGLEPVTATANHPFMAQGMKPSGELDGKANWLAAGELVASGAGKSFHALALPRIDNVWPTGTTRLHARTMVLPAEIAAQLKRPLVDLSNDYAFFSLDRAEHSIYAGTVYNLEVEEDESYTTVGGVCHNCRYYNVPPHKVQHLARATFNNIEHLSIQFVRDALTPWAIRLEQEADFKLLSQRGASRQTKLDMGWLTHGDFKSRMEGYQMGRRMGVYSINDILHREGENTIGALGDTRIVESNMQTLDQLEAGVNLGSAAGGSDKSGGVPSGDGTDTKGGDSASGASGADGVGGAPANVAHEAIVLLLSSTLDRYQSRLANREADMHRGGASNEKTDEHMAGERIKLRPWALEQAADAMALAGVTREAMLLALDAIDNGTNPRTAAEQLVAQKKVAA